MESTELFNYGIDYTNGFHRCMDNEVLYRNVLSMFLTDESYASAVCALECKNYAAAFSHLHTLKGIVGNTGMFALYDAVCPLVESMRRGKYDEKYIFLQLGRIAKLFKRAETGIRLYLSDEHQIKDFRTASFTKQ